MPRFYLLFLLAISLGSQIVYSRDWLRINGEFSSVSYPQGLDKIADSLLYIAETSLPQLAEAVNLPVSRLHDQKARIILTDAPDFANGYALENSIVIYALSSEYMTAFSGCDSWYKQVLTHELAHLVMFYQVKRKANWFGTIAYLTIPRWFWEGVAQYLTEPWNAYRGDLILKNALFDGTLNLQSLYQTEKGALLYAASHAFVKYLTRQYGDTTIAQIVTHNQGAFFFDFNDAFKKTYGASVSELFSRFMRTITLYYGNKYHDYPVSSTIKTTPFENWSVRTIIPLSACDSSWIISVQTHPNHRYFSVYESKLDKDHLVLTKKLFESCHTDLFSDPSGNRIAYGRYHLGRKENLGTYGFDWFIYNRKTGESRRIKTNIHARYAAFTSNNHLIINQIKADGSVLLRINLDTMEEDTLYTTTMPLGRISALSNEDLIIEGQSADGNRDLFLLAKQHLRNLTDDAYDDRKPIPVSDSSFVFASYRYNHPILNLYRLNQKNSKFLFYDLYDYWPETMDRARNRLYLTSYGHNRKKKVVTVIFDSLRSDTTAKSIPSPDVRYDGWQFDHSLSLPDTTLGIKQPEKIYMPQLPLSHAFSFALPVYDTHDGVGLFGLSSWFEIMQRHILLAAFILFPQEIENSFFLLNHFIKAYELDFTSILYQGPVFFAFDDGEYMKLNRQYAGIMAAKPLHISGNPRYLLNPSLAMAWQRYKSREADINGFSSTSYGIVRVGGSIEYHKPTKLHPLLSKREIYGNCYLHKAIACEKSFSIYSTDVIVGRNFLSEYLGFKLNGSWIKHSGELPPPQFLGIDRFYQTNIARDFGYTKTVRGVHEDVAGNEMFWTSNELIAVMPARTNLKLLMVPLNNPAFMVFYDQAFIRASEKEHTVFGYGLEATFGNMNLRFGFGCAWGHYSDNTLDRELYLRFALTIPGLSHMCEEYESRH